MSWSTAADRNQRVALITSAVLLGFGFVLGNGWFVWQVTRLIYDVTGVEVVQGKGVVPHLANAITWPHWHVTLTYGWTYLSLMPLLLSVVLAYSLVKLWLPWAPTRRATFWTVWFASACAGAAIGIIQLLWSILMDYLDWPIWWMLFGSIGNLVFIAEGIDWSALWLFVFATEWGVVAGAVAAITAKRSL